jgi:alpha-galactosidase
MEQQQIVPEVIRNQQWVEQVFSEDPAAPLPFSFVYGGRNSAEITATWPRKVTQRELGNNKLERTLTLTDPQTGLEVKAVAIIYTDTPGVDWTLYVTNTGAVDTPILEQVKAIDLAVDTGQNALVIFHGLHGCYPHSWLPFDKQLGGGDEVKVGAIHGRATMRDSVFWNIGIDNGGLIVAIGWSGQWCGSVTRAREGAGIRVEAGMEWLHLRLHPGESIRMPRILALHYQGEEARSYNLFRHTMFTHIMPRIKGKLVVPPIAHLSTAFYEMDYGTETEVLSQLESIRGLGFEYFWLDAYYTKGGFPGGMGNYGVPVEEIMPEPTNYPHGLKVIPEAVNKEGLKFLLWFEPERVAPGTHIATHYPHFVISPDGNGSGLYNLGLPEAREYMTEALDAAIKEWSISCLRIDYNLNPGPFWQFENEKDPDRVGMAEIRYMEGLYQMWDDLLAANPDLFIDNCASGGNRIDLETCARSLPLWRTDSTIGPLMISDFDGSALLNNLMTAALSRYVPFSTSGQMGPAPYHFRSGMNAGGISFCEDVRNMHEHPQELINKGRARYSCPPPQDLYGEAGYPREQLKAAIAEAKRLRKYYFGDFYNISAVTSSANDWCVIQYHRPETGDGLIVAYRRHTSPYGNFTCALHDIDPEAKYRVMRAIDYQPMRAQTMKGSDLVQLKIELDTKPGSMMIEYKKLK